MATLDVLDQRTPRILTRTPLGFTTRDWRPGHSVSGLLHHLDPFQRAELHSSRTTGSILRALDRNGAA